MERQNEGDLEGKVAIVTGASRGIGRHTALALARRGVNVVVTARTVEQSESMVPGTIAETAAQVAALGVGALAVGADLSKEEDLERIVESAIDRFGGVDLLVNNAAVTNGFSFVTPFLEIPRSDWLYHYAVNVHAPFTLTQLVVPRMEARGGGRILNVTTGCAETFRVPEEPWHTGVGDAHLYLLPYFSSKRALDRFSNVVAPQLAERNIFIISVMPGWVVTGSENNEEITGETMDSSGPPLHPVSIDVPARMLVYFAACENPIEYAGRQFWAERELAELGLDAKV
jgi:NAD(P)-dependent dehydrogenase (short-subunit alcohol dehydrogenase family)